MPRSLCDAPKPQMRDQETPPSLDSLHGGSGTGPGEHAVPHLPAACEGGSTGGRRDRQTAFGVPTGAAGGEGRLRLRGGVEGHTGGSCGIRPDVRLNLGRLYRAPGKGEGGGQGVEDGV